MTGVRDKRHYALCTDPLDDARLERREGFFERAARLREQTRGRLLGSSVDLIRQDRDNRRNW